jgi:predicted MPP superfamily phosphohydrolase
MSGLVWLLGAFTHQVNSEFYKETVTLIVGAAKVQYTLHKGLLCFYSDFFRAALNGSFKEATERRVELSEVDIVVFEAFQVWLYTQSFPKNELAPTKAHLEWSVLVKLWIFGDGHQIPLLQNNAMDAMLDKVTKDSEVPALWMNHAYENTTSKSHLRKALVDTIAYRALTNDDTGVNAPFADSTRLWSTQVSLDVMAEMDRGWRSKAPRYTIPKREKCYYHVHSGTEHC